MNDKKNSFVSLFSNDKLMLAATVIATIASLIQSLLNAEIVSYFSAFTFLANAICVLVLYISYKKHDKNVMKGLMGAIFMLLLLRNVEQCTNMIQNYEKPSYISVAGLAITSLFVLILMINHFIINSDRHSKPWNVKLNQSCFIILLITQVVLGMILIIISDSMFLRISYLISIFTKVSTICVIICIETKMEGYKALREANGWVEKPYSSEENESTETSAE